ncbi:S-adenosyl-L-methionine-dependent tRNA 4-demethylwyosine synthase [Geranomyces variabilis]|uniref:tRNA 4-demethylwyosine synthase (AdoMet-dependent) n=1 Tax=Geranomyces variabilis TaxID=109894 RepID=A0AAD5TUP8_9FUNG|nr:S-adenosyl-L-methionine-dependent tRNA 4-demethylwyosine synthase [Geranomyces variabilis]
MGLLVEALRQPVVLAAIALSLSALYFYQSAAGPSTHGASGNLVQGAARESISARRRRKRNALKNNTDGAPTASSCCNSGSSPVGEATCCSNSTSTTAESASSCRKSDSAAVAAEDVGFDEEKTVTVKILYGTQTRTARTLAYRVKDLVETGVPLVKEALVLNIADYENEDLFTEKSPVIFMLSTYSGGTPTEDAAWFYTWLEDSRFDHRVESTAMRNLRFAVFGLGDSVYGDDFCTVAKQVDRYIADLAGNRICPLTFGDKQKDTEAQFVAWTTLLLSRLTGVVNHLSVADSMDFFEGGEGEFYESDSDAAGSEPETEELMDLEDMGAMAAKLKAAKKSKADGEEDLAARPPKVAKEMVTPMLRKSLEKQGYKIVGTHSGVKMCRWTKAMLRGRACANKCVFCWRQHTNPVGTEFRWKVDDPLLIVDGVMEQHYKMVKQLKGVPGVKADRFEEAFTIKHCALSLVGEPIMYPHINEFVEILHSRNVSSFLVTNAQFPEAIRSMRPVTQLYVSIDAGNKEDLKKIDRPLFSDYWERFNDCLRELGNKGQRTVYRLTLVKDGNDADVSEYADLIAMGNPSFVEVKGVTYCGFSGASKLTMKNVPYHHEVLSFCERLCASLAEKGKGKNYAIASVHEHSCSVLIADKDTYFKNGEWYTWIDYNRFFELVRAGKPFTAVDYMQKSPSWAVIGQGNGFDPNETRWFRKAKQDVSGEDAQR